MELMIAGVLAFGLIALGARAEVLGEDNERVWVNHLADESRKRKAQGARRPCRYVRAGWRPER